METGGPRYSAVHPDGSAAPAFDFRKVNSPFHKVAPEPSYARYLPRNHSYLFRLILALSYAQLYAQSHSLSHLDAQ